MTRAGFFKLLAAFGFGQTGKPYQDKDKWDGPYDDGQGGCFSTNHNVLNIKRVPCKEGDEYCPLGHSQKPSQLMATQWISSTKDNAGGLGPAINLMDGHTGNYPRVCSTCGIVYVPQGEKR